MISFGCENRGTFTPSWSTCHGISKLAAAAQVLSVLAWARDARTGSASFAVVAGMACAVSLMAYADIMAQWVTANAAGDATVWERYTALLVGYGAWGAIMS